MLGSSPLTIAYNSVMPAQSPGQPCLQGCTWIAYLAEPLKLSALPVERVHIRGGLGVLRPRWLVMQYMSRRQNGTSRHRPSGLHYSTCSCKTSGTRCPSSQSPSSLMNLRKAQALRVRVWQCAGAGTPEPLRHGMLSALAHSTRHAPGSLCCVACYIAKQTL